MLLWGRKNTRADTPASTAGCGQPLHPWEAPPGAQPDPEAAQCAATPIILALIACAGQAAHGTRDKIHPYPITWDFPFLIGLSRGLCNSERS